MTSPSRTIALLGFPQTGKSTYLGAVWQIIQDARDDSMIEIDMTGDRAYLQHLGERVARAEELERTDVDSSEGMSLQLQVEGTELTLEAPDLSGETLRLLVEDRHWHPRLMEALSRADGVLLFLSPEQLRLPIRTSFTAEFLAALDEPGDAGGLDADRLATYDPRFACTAAKLVDAIENILAVTQDRWPLPMALVVSAWDTVDDIGTPADWLVKQVPALHEMARRNPDRVRAAFFGLSAQGGSLPRNRESLLAKGAVLDRAFALDEVGTPIPLAKLLSWVLWVND